MVVTVSAWFYHFIFIPEMPYQASAIFLCHMCAGVLRFQIHGGRFPHVHYRVQGNSCKALSGCRSCHMQRGLFRFQKIREVLSDNW